MMDFEEIAPLPSEVTKVLSTRKRKSIESVLEEPRTSSAKRLKVSKSTSKKSSSKKVKGIEIADIMDVNESALFSTPTAVVTDMDVDIQDEDMDAAAKRLSFGGSVEVIQSVEQTCEIDPISFITAPIPVSYPTDANLTAVSFVSSDVSPAPLNNADSSSYHIPSPKPSPRAMVSPGPIFPPAGIATRSRRSSAGSSISAPLPAVLSPRPMIAPASIPEPQLPVVLPYPQTTSIVDPPTVEVVPVAMDSPRNPMWFTWISGFLVLYLVSSSFFLPSSTPESNTLSIVEPSTNEKSAQANEPSLLFKNYSIPRVSFENNEKKSSVDEQEVVDEPTYIFMSPESDISEDNSTLSSSFVAFSAEELKNIVFVDETDPDEEVDFIPLLMDIDFASLKSISTADVSESMTETFATPVDDVVITPVVESQIVDLDVTIEIIEMFDNTLDLLQTVDEMEELPVATAVTIDNAEEILVEEAVATSHMEILPKESSLSSSMPFVLFPADMNVAESNTGALMLAKESTKKCMKANKWNPFACHRPLKTINSYYPVSSAQDCFAFYLQQEQGEEEQNVVTMKLFQPVKVIHGFGITHFVAENGQENSRFNVSCAPRDISFTVYERVPTSVIFAEDETEASKSETKKTFKFPFSFNQKDSVMSSLYIPSTFNGFVFDPLSENVARSQVMNLDKNISGMLATQYFPLASLFPSSAMSTLPQHVDKVRMQVHSTQSGGDMTCVYRVQVYGEF